MTKLKIIELFGGIGACSKALENIGIDYEIVDYVEIDKYAVASFNAIHDTNFEPQDICKWNKDIEADLIMHGSPCQDFSLAGKQAGGDKDSGTRSSLMYETIRIVEKIKPKYVIWENVKNLVSKKHIHNFEAYLEQMDTLGYNNYWKVLNAKNYGIPQNRERVYTVSIRKDINKTFEFPEGEELKLKLKDMLEDNVDEKYYLSDKQIEYLENGKYNSAKPSNKVKTTNTGIAPTLDTMSGGQRQPFIQVKNATKKGYLEAYEGDGVDISSRMKYHRGNVQPQSIQTIDCTSGEGHGVVVINKKQVLCNKLIEENKVKEYDIIRHSYSESRMKEWETRNIEKNNESPTLDTRCDCLGVAVNQPPLRIRKLTPKECWRLMGFDDESFEKAQPHNSNAQLYKQAGNSIVVNVLMAIFKNLLDD